MALLDGRGEAPPSHTWRGLAYVMRAFPPVSRGGPAQARTAGMTWVTYPAPLTMRDSPGRPSAQAGPAAPWTRLWIKLWIARWTATFPGG